MNPLYPAVLDELASRLSGDLSADRISRLLLATDGSIYRKIPAAVIHPKNAEDVRRAVLFAREHGMPLHARGAGSGLCGACIGEGIIIDFSRHMNRMIHLDKEARTVTCEPGFRFGELNAALKGTGLFLPPDPSSGEYATLGGMVGTNASGAHSVKYGNTADYLADAELVDGRGQLIRLSEIADLPPEQLPAHLACLLDLYITREDRISAAYPPVSCNTAGYNLRHLNSGTGEDPRLDLRRLICGAEGTLGMVTSLTFRLLPKPAADSLVVAFMGDILTSARLVQQILPLKPSGIEIMDRSLLDLARSADPRLRDAIPADVDNVLMVEFDGDTPEECARAAEEALPLFEAAGKNGGGCLSASVAVNAQEKAAFWAVRKAAVPILYKLKGEKKILALIEDAAVPTDRLTDYFEGIYEILSRHDVRFVTYGHIAKGLLHTRPLLNLKDADDVAKLRPLADDLYELTERLQGSVSGEHGDGRIRSAYIRRRYPEIYPLMLEVKSLMDPAGIFNPDIITRHDPDQMQKDLRYGAEYRSGDPADLRMSWPEGWLSEIEKCHGCAKCTTTTSATRMCPVFKESRRPEAAPKAKAEILRSLMSGDLASNDLFSKRFQEVMLNCAGCGSCAHECPSGVNIPKMAVEARSRYVKACGAPAGQILMGHIENMARLSVPVIRRTGSLIPTLMNAPVIRKCGEIFAGVSARRTPVKFSSRPLADRLTALELCPSTSSGGVSTSPGSVSTSSGCARDRSLSLSKGRPGTRITPDKNGPAVLYFSGCYAGYIEPGIGEAAVSVLSRMGMNVLHPPQHCCGLPLLSKGMTDAARAKMRANLARWASLARKADFITVTCSSCGYALMKDWAWLAEASDDPTLKMIADKTIHITRLVDEHRGRIPGLWKETGTQPSVSTDSKRLAWHAPCHLKIQTDPEASLRLLSRLPDTNIINLAANCCGMVGSWGLAANHDAASRRIAEDLLNKLQKTGAREIVTDCPTCRMQLLELTSLPVCHPVEVLARRLAGRLPA